MTSAIRALIAAVTLAAPGCAIDDPAVVQTQEASTTQTFSVALDTSIFENAPMAPHGSDSTLWVDGGSNVSASALLKFDLTAIPRHSIIRSATLTLWATNSSPVDFGIYELRKSWKEAEATWTQRFNGTDWTQDGARAWKDRSLTVLGTVTPTATGSVSTTFNTWGRGVVQQWVDSESSNHGLKVANPDETNGFIFQSGEGAHPPTLTVSYDPPPVNDEVHWTFTGPGAVTIDWRGPDSVVRYGTTTAYGSSKTAVHPSPLPWSSAGPFWEARITGLATNQIYHYQIGNGADHQFRTMPSVGSSDFTIEAFGDIGATTGDSAGYVAVTQVQHLVAHQQPRFALVLGDLSYAGTPSHSHSPSWVDEHFNDVMAWSQDIPYMPQWGNHEWKYPTGSPGHDDLINYKGRFDLPNSDAVFFAPTPGGEDYYYFDYGNVRFISIPEPYREAEGMGAGDRQLYYYTADYLMDQVDANPSIRYIVTFGHRPAYSSGEEGADDDLRPKLDQLALDHPKYRLDLSGHEHDYERFKPQNGLIHVVTGTGGAFAQPFPGAKPSITQRRFVHHGVLSIHFTATGISARFICAGADDLNDVDCLAGDDTLDQFTIDNP